MAAKRWNICNVLATGADTRRLWQFDAKGKEFKLNRELTVRNADSLPDAVKKSWSEIWQARLNVALLPPDRVFLRVAQFPQASYAETLAMVDLQMEKLCPMPVGQVVWTIHCIPHPTGSEQTVILIVAARDVVEAFLGTLESQGYLADRLEIPALDQLLATEVTTDGAWIYPEALGGADTALVAWWYGGVLRSLDLLTLPATNTSPGELGEQLSQMAWSGEVEGWLTSRPTWHLVVAPGVTPIWEMALRGALNETLHLVVPVSPVNLAARTAKRAASHDASSSLLPSEIGNRYRQSFVDRLWMRGLGAVVLFYLFCLAIYFGWLGVSWFRTNSVEKQVAALSNTYTNAIQVRTLYNILQDRQELKFAGLDCWKVIAERLPDGASLDGFNFNDGQRLTLNGSASQDAVTALIDFDKDVRKYKNKDGKDFFRLTGDPFSYRTVAGGVTWNLSLELRRTEAQ